jgi:hypothetical protein
VVSRNFRQTSDGTLSMEDLHSIFEIETFDEEKRSNGYSQIVNGLEYNLAPEDYDARSPNSVSNRPIV